MRRSSVVWGCLWAFSFAVCAAGAQSHVQTGIDVLESDRFAALRRLVLAHHGHLRLGLVTHRAAVDAHGRRTVDVLFHDAPLQALGVQLVTLFAPEHGLDGALDTAHVNNGSDYTIANGTDAATGLPIISLFGNTEAERRPRLDDLRSLDAIVLDLQDAGVRFYTYETVVGYFLEAAARTHTPVLLLDRPNPIRGDVVEGPTSTEPASYIHYTPLPLRHGLTLGEYARMVVRRKHLRVELTVVPMRGWRRSLWMDQTGLPWQPPSPSLQTMQALALYPALGILEGANLSVGRGTPTPFEVLGAPWLDSHQLIDALRAERLHGVRFEAVDFTPARPYKLGGILCHGLRMQLTDRDAVSTPRLGALLAYHLYRLYGAQSGVQTIDPAKLDDATLRSIVAGKREELTKSWSAPLRRFTRERRQLLAYP